MSVNDAMAKLLVEAIRTKAERKFPEAQGIALEWSQENNRVEAVVNTGTGIERYRVWVSGDGVLFLEV